MELPEPEMVRDELIAKIKALAPRAVANPTIARVLELGNTDELRRHLAWAQILAEIGSEDDDADEYLPPDPRLSTEELETRARLLRTRTGSELPPHCYVLAADEWKWAGAAYDGPRWVPFNLWELYRAGQPIISDCARKLIDSTGAQSLWAAIANRFERPDNIAAQLPIACAEAVAGWRTQPRIAPAEWKRAREELARKARQLATELERFFLPRDADANEFPGLLDFTQLLDDDEIRRLDTNIRRTAFAIHNAALDRADVRHTEWKDYNGSAESGYMPASADVHRIYDLLLEDHDEPSGDCCIVPTLPDMMRRIADQCEADAADPPLSRPNAANAERNYFARALIKYFRNAGDASPTVIADIVTMFYPQGMDANEVSQLIRKTPRWQRFEIITSPETSLPE